MGLVRAVEKYNPNSNANFSTYASIWIRSLISKYIAANKYMIKLPQNIKREDIP